MSGGKVEQQSIEGVYSFIQICHFSLTQEVLSFERLGREADLDPFHHS